MRTTAALLATLLLTAAGPACACDDTDASCTQTQHELRRHGWGTFFGEAGFALGAAIAVPVLDDAGWDASRDETAIGILPPVLSGLGSALGLVAEEGAWDVGWGWALAGTWPGAILGANVGILSALGAHDRDAMAAALGIGVASGALLGALATYAELASGGRPGALTGGIYAGYFTGLATGLASFAMGDGVEAELAPFVASTVGALLGALIIELLERGAPS